MFKIFLTLIFSFILTKPFCQNVNISGIKNNVIYCNVDNPLYITAGNYDSDEIIVDTNKGILSKGYSGIYTFRCSEFGQVLFSVFSKKDKKLIGTFSFRAKSIPDPKVTIFPSENGNVKITTLQSLNVIGLILSDFDFDVRYQLDSFCVKMIYQKKRKTKEFLNKTNILSIKILNELKFLQPNDLILITKAYATGPDQKSKLLDSAFFTVIE